MSPDHTDHNDELVAAGHRLLQLAEATALDQPRLLRALRAWLRPKPAYLVALRELLINDEGRSRRAYTDSEGFLTIGVGRLVDPRKAGGLSDDEIDYLLDNDIERQAELETEPYWGRLNDARKAVVFSMGFQLGPAGFRRFSQLREALTAGDWDRAAAEMLDSRWARQTPRRAQRLAAVMKTGKLNLG